MAIKKNIFSILVALFILYLSLTNSSTFEKVSIFTIPFIDKIVHFGMYFIFMSVIIFENRKTLINIRFLLLAAIIPLFYGVLMEILQAVFTTSRSGSIYDVIANLTGILVSILIWLWVKPLLIKEEIR
ncbi:MAG: VanZ family protein [Bacteroidales bacterium]|nr:VanZ family protein [Bacteroidales bacterium]